MALSSRTHPPPSEATSTLSADVYRLGCSSVSGISSCSPHSIIALTRISATLTVPNSVAPRDRKVYILTAPRHPMRIIDVQQKDQHDYKALRRRSVARFVQPFLQEVGLRQVTQYQIYGSPHDSLRFDWETYDSGRAFPASTFPYGNTRAHVSVESRRSRHLPGGGAIWNIFPLNSSTLDHSSSLNTDLSVLSRSNRS